MDCIETPGPGILVTPETNERNVESVYKKYALHDAVADRCTRIMKLNVAGVQQTSPPLGGGIYL